MNKCGNSWVYLTQMFSLLVVKNDCHLNSKNLLVYFYPFLNVIFHQLSSTPSFPLFQEPAREGVGNKDINSFCKESYTNIFTYEEKCNTSELRRTQVYEDICF
jgi:hypothetical protein